MTISVQRTPSTAVRAGVALLVLLTCTLGYGCRSGLSSSSGPAAAALVLDRLAVVPRPAPDPTYRRAVFGRAWADVDHDGCSQRAQALAIGLDRSLPYWRAGAVDARATSRLARGPTPTPG